LIHKRFVPLFLIQSNNDHLTETRLQEEMKDFY
jgi:hypothetical protein